MPSVRSTTNSSPTSRGRSKPGGGSPSDCGLARVLDAGSGTGLPTAKMLAEAGFEVLGVDVSGEMVRLARRNVPGARFEQKDLDRLELSEHSFDAVTAFFSLLFLSRAQVETTLGVFSRGLRPGGHLLISMVDGDCDALNLSFRGMSARWTAYPQAEFERVLGRAGFEILRSEALDFTPPSPDLHPERQLFFYCRRA
jgi:SAM-dependent methyltransferase